MTALFTLHGLFIFSVAQTPISSLQTKYLHWNYTHQIVFFVILPILILTFLKRKSTDYGLYWNRNVAASVATLLGLTLVLPFAVDVVQGELNWKQGNIVYVISTLFFQLILSGCGEELYFRGIYQGEINRVAGRPWTILGNRCGMGFLIAGLFFGLAHLGVVECFLYGSALNLVAFLITFIIGCFLGLARETAGSILVIGILHGGIDTYSALVTPTPAGQIVHVLGLGAAFWLVFSGKLRALENSIKD
ncbi:MAG: CPBP family intramembrane metalloprotease [Planctomycetes bacterium]|nr:CPBP family intramembrane metalloprotease [Planctomycetota bacterium]